MSKRLATASSPDEGQLQDEAQLQVPDLQTNSMGSGAVVFGALQTDSHQASGARVLSAGP